VQSQIIKVKPNPTEQIPNISLIKIMPKLQKLGKCIIQPAMLK
jgi:hypothetical protein